MLSYFLNIVPYKSHWRFYLVLLAAWMLIGYSILYPSLLERRRLYQQSIDFKSMLTRNQQQEVSGQKQQAQFATLNKQYQSLCKQFFTQQKISEVLAEIAKIGMDYRLKFKLLSPLSKLSHDFYHQYPIKMIMRGSYQALILFLSQITQLPAQLTIDNFELSLVIDEQHAVNAETNLEMILQVSIYHFRKK